MEAVLASSPVWYQSRACDATESGYFAFASRSLVYLLDIRGTAPRHYGILSGHEERVSTCSFGVKGANGEPYLISGADDGFVKCWDIHTKKAVKAHKSHGAFKVVCLHCSPASNNLVVSGDEKGFIVVWNVDSDQTKRFMPDGGVQQMLSAITCSHHHSNLVAVGYKSGAVSIIDIRKNGNVIRKLRGHGNEIHSIVWSASPSEDIFVSKLDSPNNQTVNEHDSFQSIVVTSSKDRTLRLWSLSKGKCIKIIKLPSKPSKDKGRRISEDSSRLYVALHWPKSLRSKFLSCSYNGDIILWDVSMAEKEQYKILSHSATELGHQRIVFNISSGLDPTKNIITTSMDRCIKYWSLEEPDSPPIWSLPTLGGFVYAMKVSPIDPTVIALGIGDGVIRIWRTSNPRNPFDITSLWQGIKEKVMSLAWHPTKEGLLAFGTEDGKVGVVDVLSQQPPMISNTYHMKPVYAMSWGPKCYAQSAGVTPAISMQCLYTCGGEGVVLMHPSVKMDQEAVNVNEIILSNNSCIDLTLTSNKSEISWRPDGEFVAIGNDDGSFDICRAPFLYIITRVKVHNKIINCLAWHTANETVLESKYWIASGSNSSVIYINNLNHVLNQQVAAGPVVTQPFRTLTGHCGRITSLSWNPDSQNQLVSASYDGTAQVWDVLDEEPVSNYRGHDGRLLCVVWRRKMDEDERSGLIYSGADDYAVHVWKMEDQKDKVPPKGFPKIFIKFKKKIFDKIMVGYTQKQSAQWKKKNKKKKSNRNNDPLPSPQPGYIMAASTPYVNGLAPDVKPTIDSDIEVMLERRKAELLAEMNLDTKQDTEDHSFTPSKRRQIKNIFPLSVAMDNKKKIFLQKDCIEITKHKKDPENHKVTITDASNVNMGFYTDRLAAYRMMHQEDLHLRETKYFNSSSMLKLWRGDIVGMIESAIEQNDLSDQLVSMAPMAGYDLWQKASLAYAQQLQGEGCYIHASQYLIACDKIEEAIILLRNHKHYREAVALARARLTDDDPILIDTLKIWAKKLQYGGSYEHAAKCFAAIGDHVSAAKSLSSRAASKSSLGRDELQSLFASSSVAAAADDKSTSQVNLTTGQWKGANEAVEL
uniref:Uncharacterized protein n=1 Tax=Ciona intestinalis TaxID=7719 RepID=F6ZHD7_CIOIN